MPIATGKNPAADNVTPALRHRLLQISKLHTVIEQLFNEQQEF